MYSIVIPTMWQSEYLFDMLPIYENCELVKEIILIDNFYQKKPKLDKFKKIKYYSEFKNIFVNPAWNVGVKLSNYEIILANDDILIQNLMEVLMLIKNSDFDFVGISWDEVDELKIVEIDEFKRNGYGCFMYIKNYIEIPKDYLIFRGDYILFNNSKKRGELFNPKIKGDIAKTRGNNEIFKDISQNDLKKYKINNQVL